MTHLRICGFHDKYRFLSNFAPSLVELDGETYLTVEHAYVAAKTLNFTAREEIRLVPSAGQVKRIGRKLLLREDWEDIKIDVMRDLLIQKFALEPLRSQLLETGLAYLEETNTWNDKFWGVCNGQGENHLGLLLMWVREQLTTMPR